MLTFKFFLLLKKREREKKAVASLLIFQSPEALTFLQQLGAGIQQRSSYHHHRGGAITSLNILGFGQFHQLKHIWFRPYELITELTTVFGVNCWKKILTKLKIMLRKRALIGQF